MRTIQYNIRIVTLTFDSIFKLYWYRKINFTFQRLSFFCLYIINYIFVLQMSCCCVYICIQL